MEAPTPRKSNRVPISFAAWLSALSTSWRSILLTMSKLLSATRDSSPPDTGPVAEATGQRAVDGARTAVCGGGGAAGGGRRGRARTGGGCGGLRLVSHAH